MKNLLLIFSSSLLILSCDSKPSETTALSILDSTPKVETTSTPIESLCYRYASREDTVLLNAYTSDGTVSGSLNYNLYQKDRNKGTITGVMKGDTLVADYTFKSEGRESVRQVIFLKKGASLQEGYGDMTDQNGKFVFENVSKVKFGKGIVLKEIDCK